MKVKHVRAFGGSLLMGQQVVGVFQCLKDLLMPIWINALTSLHILLNSKFGIVQGMRTVRLTSWLNKLQALTSEDVNFILKGGQCKRKKASQIVPKFIPMSLGPI